MSINQIQVLRDYLERPFVQEEYGLQFDGECKTRGHFFVKHNVSRRYSLFEYGSISHGGRTMENPFGQSGVLQEQWAVHERFCAQVDALIEALDLDPEAVAEFAFKYTESTLDDFRLQYELITPEEHQERNEKRDVQYQEYRQERQSMEPTII